MKTLLLSLVFTAGLYGQTVELLNVVPSLPPSGTTGNYVVKDDSLFQWYKTRWLFRRMLNTGTVTTAEPAQGATPRYALAGHWSQSATKTNIGASFVNVYTQTNADGKSLLIDTNGKDSVLVCVNWNKIGSGTQSVEVTDGTNQLITLNVVSGFNQARGLIPAAFQNKESTVWVRVKSTTAADDPVFEAAAIYLK